MKRTIVFAASLLFLVPSVSFASSFTQPQINAIVGLLQAFNVAQDVINTVLIELSPTTLSITPQVPENIPTPLFGGTGTSTVTVVPSGNQTHMDEPVVDPTAPVLTANFEKTSVINSMATKDNKYPQILYFDVGLSSSVTPIDQLEFSVVMPEGVITTGVSKWPGSDSSTAAFAVRASQPGSYDIVITATDPSGASVSKTLTVIAH